MKTSAINKVSKKQQERNKELSKNREQLSEYCEICGGKATDLAHLFPRSLAPEYYSELWNNRSLCRTCHNAFDNDIWFRREQKKLYNIAYEHDPILANKHFMIREDILEDMKDELDNIFVLIKHISILSTYLHGKEQEKMDICIDSIYSELGNIDDLFYNIL